MASVMHKGQESIHSWGNNLLAVGGELKAENYSYTIHMMRPTKDREWEYMQEKSVAPPNDGAEKYQELDDLWDNMDEDELNELKPAAIRLTVPLVGGDTAVIKNNCTWVIQ